MHRGIAEVACLVPCVALLLPAAAAAQAPATKVVVSRAIEQEVQSGQTFIGTVMPVRASVVGTAVDGRVLDFPVNDPEDPDAEGRKSLLGVRVTKGQALCQLRTQTLEIQLAAAQAELDVRREEYKEYEGGLIEQALAQMKAAEAQAKYAIARRERARSLFRRGNVTDEELEQAIAEAEKAEQILAEKQAELKLVEDGPRQAQALARVASAQAEVDRLKDMIEKHTMRAPFDGYVVDEHVEEGMWVSQADPVVEVVELDQVDVEASVLERYIRHLWIGMPVRVEITALPGENFTGKVVNIVPQADVRARSFPVRVRVENVPDKGGLLIKAGMFARVTLGVGKTESALLVPKDSLVLGGPRPKVFVVQEGQDPTTVQPIDVELGVASGNLIQVRGKLEPGQQVVVVGNERLRPGGAVIITREVEYSAGSFTTTP